MPHAVPAVAAANGENEEDYPSSQSEAEAAVDRHTTITTAMHDCDPNVSSKSITITVPEGRLGISLRLHSDGEGAKVTNIASDCPLLAQIDIGDLIMAIDGEPVTSLQDFNQADKKSVRKFEIVKGGIEYKKSAAMQKLGDSMKRTIDSRQQIKIYQQHLLRSCLGNLINNQQPRPQMSMNSAQQDNTQPATPAPLNNSQQQKPSPEKLTTDPPSVQRDVTSSPPINSSCNDFNDYENEHERYPILSQLGAIGSNSDQTQLRRRALAELLQYDKSHGIKTKTKLLDQHGKDDYRVICFPLKSRQKSLEGEDNDTYKKSFLKYEHYGVMDQLLSAWGFHYGGTNEDAAGMILHYFAKRFPQTRVESLKQVEDGMIDLPPDFVSYDGTNHIKWNTRYKELLKYQEEHGDLKVYTKSELGKWVSLMRKYRAKGLKSLTPKRIELLDDIGFIWRCNRLPEGHQRQTSGGDPRQNRAIAAKLVWPDLTMRDALHLGGLEDEELNAVHILENVNTPVRTRTNYVYHKESIRVKLKRFATEKKSTRKTHIQNLVDILEGDEEDRFEQVFGEFAGLLPGYLEAAEENKRSGISKTPLVRRKRPSRELYEQVFGESAPGYLEAAEENKRSGISKTPLVRRKRSNREVYVASNDDDDDNGEGEEQPYRKHHTYNRHCRWFCEESREQPHLDIADDSDDESSTAIYL